MNGSNHVFGATTSVAKSKRVVDEFLGRIDQMQKNFEHESPAVKEQVGFEMGLMLLRMDLRNGDLSHFHLEHSDDYKALARHALSDETINYKTKWKPNTVLGRGERFLQLKGALVIVSLSQTKARQDTLKILGLPTRQDEIAKVIGVMIGLPLVFAAKALLCMVLASLVAVLINGDGSPLGIMAKTVSGLILVFLAWAQLDLECKHSKEHPGFFAYAENLIWRHLFSI